MLIFWAGVCFGLLLVVLSIELVMFAFFGGSKRYLHNKGNIPRLLREMAAHYEMRQEMRRMKLAQVNLERLVLKR